MTGKDRIIEFLSKNGPSTDEQIASGTGLNPSSARTRRHELEREGIVLAVDYGLTKSNRSTFIWDLTNSAKLWLRNQDVSK